MHTTTVYLYSNCILTSQVNLGKYATAEFALTHRVEGSQQNVVLVTGSSAK